MNEYNAINSNIIMILLHSIENKTGIMAQHDSHINCYLDLWYADKLNSSYFCEMLCRYLDNLNEGNKHE